MSFVATSAAPLRIPRQNESFKAQVFLEATLRYPSEIDPRDDADVLTIFQRATVENSLAKPEDDGHPKLMMKRRSLEMARFHGGTKCVEPWPDTYWK